MHSRNWSNFIPSSTSVALAVAVVELRLPVEATDFESQSHGGPMQVVVKCEFSRYEPT